MFHAPIKTGIEGTCLTLEQTTFDRQAGVAQQCQAATGNLRIGILHRDHHPSHPGGDQRGCARWRAAMVGARFQRDVCGRPRRRFAGICKGVDLGMRRTGTQMRTLPDYPSIAHQ